MSAVDGGGLVQVAHTDERARIKLLGSHLMTLVDQEVSTSEAVAFARHELDGMCLRSVLPKVEDPMSLAELLRTGARPPEDLVQGGIVPADANILVAAYPKTHKTNLVLELAVALVSGTPFLARFGVRRQCRVGIVLTEDAPHRIARRLDRLCMGHGVQPSAVADRLHFWFRPQLRLGDPRAMHELGQHVARLDLDLIAVDNWSYVSSGDSNDATNVTTQLAALSGLRALRPGLTVLLVQHARKQGADRGVERLTDSVRNSSAFGAWFDTGILLSRKDEHAPVTVRLEMREQEAPGPFSFAVEDEYPAKDDCQASGFLRLTCQEPTRQSANALLTPVLEYVTQNPGISKRKLRVAVRGDNGRIDEALRLLAEAGKVRIEPPRRRGSACRIHPTVLNRAGTVLSAQSVNRADRAAPPEGGRTQRTPLLTSLTAASTVRAVADHSDVLPDDVFAEEVA